jgi:hypothetical protein
MNTEGSPMADTELGNGHVDAPDARVTELELLLARERVVRENLAARVGALIAENLELLVRLNEQQQEAPL